MSGHMNVLFVDDDPVDVLIVKKLLSSSGRYCVQAVSSHEEAKARIDQSKFDVTLLDLSLSGTCGMETVLTYRNYGADIPAIILTGLDDEKIAREAVRNGAQDYLLKGQIEVISLERSIRYAVDRHALLEKIVGLTQKLMEAERSRVVEETAGGVAHELYQPLTVAMTSINMLLKRSSPNDDRFGMLQTLFEACQKMEEIVGNIRNAKQYITHEYINDTRVLDFSGPSRINHDVDEQRMSG